MHLNLDDPVALTGLATPPFDIEGEAPGLIAALLGLRQPGKPVADWGEGPGVSRWIRTRSPPNRALVNVDDLIEMLQPFDRLTRRRRLSRTIQIHRSGLEQRLNRQGRFTTP